LSRCLLSIAIYQMLFAATPTWVITQNFVLSTSILCPFIATTPDARSRESIFHWSWLRSHRPAYERS
jgi:hypothetical protein